MFTRSLKPRNTFIPLFTSLMLLLSTGGCGELLLLAGIFDIFRETPDTTSPTVVSTSPDDGATGVAANQSIAATFSEDMDASSLAAAFSLKGPGETAVDGALTYDVATRIATFTPTDNLAFNSAFTATLSTGACDLGGNGLANDFTWDFTTGATADTTAPTVISTTPVDGATGVTLIATIAATFSESMDPLTITTTDFSLTGPGDTSVAGTIVIAGNVATFTPANDLATSTTFTAVIATGVTDLAGNGLANDFSWSFATGATAEPTAPTVSSTTPVNGATGVTLNATIAATFSEAMDPLTITTANFSLTGPGATPVAGTVVNAGNVATFTPASDLTTSTTFAATITTGVTNLAGAGLANDFTWSFTTGATADTTAPTVSSTNPGDTATGVPINKKMNATFSEAMDPLTISTANYTVTGPGASSINGTVSYDVANHIATFMPVADFAPNAAFEARISTGVNDLAGNTLASDFVWSFTTGATLVVEPVNLGLLSTFAAVAGAGLTNSNSAGQTTINGDVGLSPAATCLGDGSPCSALNPLINGTLYANDPGGIAAAAMVNLTLAYTDAAGRPPGTTVNDLSGMVLPPGVYTSGSTMSIAVGGTLTLDAQGDANAVWIFQIGSSLTVNNSAQVLLINGANASNVYWAIFASSTVGTNVSFKGNVLAGASNSLGTGSTVEGRMLCTTGQITLLSNTVTVPAP